MRPYTWYHAHVILVWYIIHDLKALIFLALCYFTQVDGVKSYVCICIWHITKLYRQNIPNKQRVLVHRHQGWNVRHGLCHICMRYLYIYELFIAFVCYLPKFTIFGKYVRLSVCLSVCLSVLSSITHERFDISSPNLVHIWNGWAVPVRDIDK